MYVCVCIRLDLSFYSVDFNRTGLILFIFIFFLLCDCWSKIRFLIGAMRFCFISTQQKCNKKCSTEREGENGKFFNRKGCTAGISI